MVELATEESRPDPKGPQKNQHKVSSFDGRIALEKKPLCKTYWQQVVWIEILFMAPRAGKKLYIYTIFYG